MKKYEFDSPLGNVTILFENETLFFLNFSDSAMVNYFCKAHEENDLCENNFTHHVRNIIQDYLNGKISTPLPFSIQLTGSDFQKKVWNALLKIPYGETITYTDLAIRTGNPKAVRAVGNAVSKNPLLLIIPCHRITPKNQTNCGQYSGGQHRKSALLKMEDVNQNV